MFKRARALYQTVKSWTDLIVIQTLIAVTVAESFNHYPTNQKCCVIINFEL